MCIACIQKILSVEIRAIIVWINLAVVTDGHRMSARNLIDLKASAGTGPVAHVDNKYLACVVGDGVLKLISWTRL